MEAIIYVFIFLLGGVTGFLMARSFYQTLVRTERTLLEERVANLANRIFDTKGAQFREDSERNLSQLLSPLKDRIAEFQKKVEDTYSSEARERFALKKEIERIVEVNEKITLEAGELTKALRGDVKAQGNWGEIILEKILEASGLREGAEYTVQGRDMALVDSEGRRLQPDVIVNLPDGKHVIVDAKVSLTHYERYISAADDAMKVAAIKGFLGSIHAHVDGLSAKNYQNLDKLNSPDFVLMFIPIEGAFSVALQQENALFNYAWNKAVVIVSPTTLLATLRTISSIWKQENQTKNALEIARQGGALYDKFVAFVADLDTIGESLSKTQDVYTEAMGKLKSGKGNLISRVETLRKLGAKATKALPATAVDASSGDEM